MERAELLRILDEKAPAHAAAQLAVRHGARFKVWVGSVPSSRLAAIYRRRERLSHRKQQPSIGFVEAVRDLSTYGSAPVLIGYVDDRERSGYRFQLFVTEDQTQIVACLGVVPPVAVQQQSTATAEDEDES